MSILPVPTLGSSSRITTDLGALKAARRSRTHAISSASVGRGAGHEAHEGARHLAPALVGDADHGGLAHGRVELERLLDLDRRDVLAAGHDEVLGAVDDGEVAVGVDHGEVAGAQPAAAQHLGGRLGRVEVADHHVVAPGADLADGPPVPRHLDVVVVEHADVDAEDRDARWWRAGRGSTARPGFGRLRVRVGELSVMP